MVCVFARTKKQKWKIFSNSQGFEAILFSCDNRWIWSSLSSGFSPAWNSSMPTDFATLLAVVALSPVNINTRRSHCSFKISTTDAAFSRSSSSKWKSVTCPSCTRHQDQGRHILFENLLLDAKWFDILLKQTLLILFWGSIRRLIVEYSQKVNAKQPLNTNHFVHTYLTA